MAAKEAGFGVRVCAVLFTSIVAPLVVNVVCQDIKEEEVVSVRVGQQGSPPGKVAGTGYPTPLWQALQPVPVIASFVDPACVTQVVARGIGRTPESALRDALRAAICQAVAAQVDADTWARDGRALCERACRDGRDLVLSYRDLGAGRELKLTGVWHHRDVAVTVNRQAVGARLQAAVSAGR